MATPAPSPADLIGALFGEAGEGDAARVAELLAAGADPLGCDVHGIPVWLFAVHRPPELFSLLFPRRNWPGPDRHGNTALIRAAAAGNLPLVQMLLPDEDPLAANWNGSTALMAAAVGGHARIGAALLPLSDLSAVDRAGRGHIDLAMEGGHADFIRMAESFALAQAERRSLDRCASAGSPLARRARI